MTTELSFGFENKNQEYTWKIKSSQGQTILSHQSNQFEKIDVSQLSSGVYYLEIELGNQKITKRLVKQ
jgi:predicted secreted protein